MQPTDQINSLHIWHNQTREMLILISRDREHVSFQFPEIDTYLVKVKVPGSFLDATDFHELKIGIESLTLWTDLLRERGEEYAQLASLSKGINVDPELVGAIERTIDEKGEVRDSASQVLSDIRSKITSTERSVRSAIQKVLKKAKSDEFVDEDSAVTVRDGRLVIPVRAEYKKQVSGFVHDESATGQTVFMEPGEVLELNNEVQELKYAESREIIRILVALSDQIRANLKMLEKGTLLLEILDFIYAKAKLADHLDAVVPTFTKSQKHKLVNAVHPLLYLSHKESKKKVVPLNLVLDQTDRILIISGPNAGGKSVALKTVGLLQYMFQCGLPVPVGEESSFGVFSSIFLDIGDTQSIEDDLSTYSSHLRSMKHFLKYADKRTLFLIDEFGKGTEPQFGGAIAESVLRELNKLKATGIVTTHYQNLKKVGDEEGGIVNGAMKYDLNALEPLFELEIGKPGSSFAFEIAAKIGLPKAIIESSKKKIGSEHVAYDQLLNQLEKEKSLFEKENQKLAKEKSELQKMRKDYEDLRTMLESERSKVIKDAKRDAKNILEDANKDVERVIREIKENAASKQKTKELRKGLDAKKSKLVDAAKQTKQTFKAGDPVRVVGQESAGIIQKVKGKQAEVLFGSIKSIVSVDKLEPTKAPPMDRHKKKVKKLGIDLAAKMASFSHELSIRGVRAEEAIPKIEAFIDEALVVGVNEVRIVHGKGHGVLREIVRTYTKDHPRIASVTDEHADRGGAGISIIKFE